MKKNNTRIYLGALVAVALASTAHAAVTVIDTHQTLDGQIRDGYTNPDAVDIGGPNPTQVNSDVTGTRRFGYRAKVTFLTSNVGSWNTTVTAGGWSYADIRDDHYFTGNNGNTGWGHASRWYLIELTENSDLNISIVGATEDALPGFVIFGDESMRHEWGNAHRYSNNGVEMFRNDGWDLNGPGDTRGLDHVAHGFNAGGNSLNQTLNLDAGLYTIAFGNIGSSTMTTGGKTFDIVMAIPEPSTALLGLLGALACFRRRR